MPFELFTTKTGKFRFRLKAANNQIILASQDYVDKSGAQNGIASVKKNAGSATNYASKTAKDGRIYFVLKAKNGEIIGTSQMYTSMSAHNNGMKAVMSISEQETKDV